jgi:DNA gyrase subunit A
MISVDSTESTILVVSENGYGKRTDVDDYRVTNRGGKGVKTINVTEKTGKLVSIKDVTDKDDLMIINRSGIVIRIAMSSLRVMGRATQGVKLITLKGKDSIASVAKVEHDDEEVLDESVIVTDGEVLDVEEESTDDLEEQPEEEDDAEDKEENNNEEDK